MYILILLVATTLVIYVVPIVTPRRILWDSDDAFETGIAFVLITVFCGIIFALIYGCCMQTVAELVVYQDMISEYEVLVEEAQQAVLDSDSEIPVENLQHSTAVVDRMVEVRDYRRWYRDTLAGYRKYRANWFFRQFIPALPEELKDSA